MFGKSKKAFGESTNYGEFFGCNKYYWEDSWRGGFRPEEKNLGEKFAQIKFMSILTFCMIEFTIWSSMVTALAANRRHGFRPFGFDERLTCHNTVLLAWIWSTEFYVFIILKLWFLAHTFLWGTNLLWKLREKLKIMYLDSRCRRTGCGCRTQLTFNNNFVAHQISRIRRSLQNI